VRPWGRAKTADYQRLDLRAHALLAGVPLHDVWQVELPGSVPNATLDEVRRLMSAAQLTSLNPAVRALFRLRAALGRWLRWDSGRPHVPGDSYLAQLDADDRARSRAEPGSQDGHFTLLYAFSHESVSEIRNATVHAFSVLALEPRPDGHRLYWAIYVKPVSGLTRLYMALIDPFRRAIVYPAILQHLHRAWRERAG
jgi:hypothetical protein